MKALSLRQPWAWAVVHGGKRVENRVAWSSCAFTGPFLIHASKWPGGADTTRDNAATHEFMGDCQGLAKVLDMTRSWDGPLTPRMLLEHRGGFVGRARVVGALSTYAQLREWIRRGALTEEQEHWYFGHFALVLADVEPIPFVPYKGSLGFFDVPDDIVQTGAG